MRKFKVIKKWIGGPEVGTTLNEYSISTTPGELGTDDNPMLHEDGKMAFYFLHQIKGFVEEMKEPDKKDIVKLYDIPRGSKVVAIIQKSENERTEATITFHHLDGAYSYCTVDGTEDVVHISASAELEKLDDGTYKLL